MKTLSKKRFKTFSLVFAIILLCPLLLGASKVSPTSDFYINDYAEVLTAETKNELMANAVKLQQDTTAQVVFLSVDNLDGEDIQEYSVDVFRSFGIGDKEKDNGVLILLSLKDRKMWVTTGYGVEGTLTDAKIGALRDTYAMPYYKNDDFDSGTKELFNAIINELRVNEYGLEPIGEYENIDSIISQNTADDEIPPINFVYAFLPFGLVALIFLSQKLKMLYLKLYDKRHGTNKAKVYKGKIKARRKAASQRSNDDDYHHGGFYGGFGGGGGFLGGGGGGFSGGGGSTGGGGAGGSF